MIEKRQDFPHWETGHYFNELNPHADTVSRPQFGLPCTS
jgi:hypothetical protein